MVLCANTRRKASNILIPTLRVIEARGGRGSGANRRSVRDCCYLEDTSSSRQDGLPDCGRSGIFEAELREAELALANAMYQLDTRERDRCVPETFEAEHDFRPGLDVAVALLDQIIEIFRGSDLRVLRQQAMALSGWGYCKDAAGCVEAQHHEASLNNAI